MTDTYGIIRQRFETHYFFTGYFRDTLQGYGKLVTACSDDFVDRIFSQYQAFGSFSKDERLNGVNEKIRIGGDQGSSFLLSKTLRLIAKSHLHDIRCFHAAVL